MRCHYEVLELSTDADDSEIKSSYRRLALKWHPDKNLDSPELAKDQFQIVQQAYEVLSDKQERAWYDAHRDQILRGRNSEFEDKSLDVFQYFTTTCFKGYGDDESGFYTIYKEVFEQIAKEDLEFIDEQEEFCEIPSFGKSDSDYEEIKTFYDYWMSYSTKKSYSWLDPYDIREGIQAQVKQKDIPSPSIIDDKLEGDGLFKNFYSRGKGDRRVLKIIEKENKKIRLKAKKERNEEVRNLVAFVRKRDKRVQAYKKELDAKTLQNRKKQELLSKQKRLERKELHNTETQADWLKFDNVQSELEEVEKHLAQEFGEDLSNSDEEDFNNLYCVACNKMFKTPKSFENHELSKKHRDNVEILKESMLEEDLESNMTDDMDEFNDELENNSKDVDEISGDESIGDEEHLPEISDSTKKKKYKGKNKKLINQSRNENEDLSDDGILKDTSTSEANYKAEESNDLGNSEELDKETVNDPGEIVNPKGKKKNKKAINTLNEEHNGLNDELHKDFGIGGVSDDDFDFGMSKSQKKKNKKGSTNKSKPNTNNDDKKGDKEPGGIINFDKSSNGEEGHKMKKDTKKEKKANKKDVQVRDRNEIDITHCCVTCKGDFSSKNKLFDHLKKTGHGVYIPSNVKQANKKCT